MTIRNFFRDSVDDNEREYDMQDFSRFHRLIFGGNGFSNTEDTDNMKYKAKEDMKGEVGSGYVEVDGYVMQLTEPEELEHASADPDNDRIDLVVAEFKFNPEKAKFEPKIKKGSPDSKPSAPSLTQNDDEYELAIAEVKVKADESSIKDGNITDKREDHYIPLDNLQRGVQVDEFGLTTMPNQSYVDIRKTGGDFKMTKGHDDIPFDDTEEDQQNEVDGKQFIPKSDGIYSFDIHVRADESDLKDVIAKDKADIQTHINVNNKRDHLPIMARVIDNPQDNNWYGSQTIKLKKGDKVKLQTHIEHYAKTPDIPIRNVVCRIAKIA